MVKLSPEFVPFATSLWLCVYGRMIEVANLPSDWSHQPWLLTRKVVLTKFLVNLIWDTSSWNFCEIPLNTPMWCVWRFSGEKEESNFFFPRQPLILFSNLGVRNMIWWEIKAKTISKKASNTEIMGNVVPIDFSIEGERTVTSLFTLLPS